MPQIAWLLQRMPFNQMKETANNITIILIESAHRYITSLNVTSKPLPPTTLPLQLHVQC